MHKMFAWLPGDRLIKYSPLLSLITQVHRRSLYLGLTAMLISSLLDGLGMGLLLPFLRTVLNESAVLQLPQLFLTTGLNHWLAQQDKAMLIVLFGAVYIGMIAVKVYFFYFSQVLTADYREELLALLKKRMYEDCLNAPMSYFDSVQLGKLSSSLIVEVSSVGSMINAFFNAITNLLIVAAYLLALIFVSWQLTLLVIALLSTVAFGLTYLMKKIKESGRSVVAIKRGMSARLTDSLSGIRVVKSSGAEAFELREFGAICDTMKRANDNLHRKENLIEPLTELITMGAAMAILIGSYQFLISMGLLGRSELLLFMLVLIRVLPVTKRFNTARSNIQENFSALDKVIDTLSLPLRYPPPSGHRLFTGLSRGIVFKDVKFGYPNRPLLLDGLNLEIRCGQTVALVGASGAGKSTLATLIPRLYELLGGSLTINGEDIRSYDIASLRRHIGIVAQDTYIFNASVKYNITYGLEGIDEHRIVEVARLANAHEFISKLPDGYHTLLGDRGVQLSGGQRQRLAIARAILRDPDILVLDEATSALDSQSEALVQEALERIRHNRTVLVIAHRLATVRSADQIVVMEKGQILEQGTHEQLIARRGLYWSYNNLQALPV